MRKRLVQAAILPFFSCIGYAQENSNAISLQNALSDFSSAQNTRIYTGSAIPTFSSKEQTSGSRYLYNDWATGTLVTTGGEQINHHELLYNYDKMGKVLLVTADKQIIIEVNAANIQSFTLSKDSQEMVFEKVSQVSNENFLQVLYKDTTKYSLYKQVKTVFEKANYTTDGIYEYGHKYDAFIDNSTYYVTKAGSKNVIVVADLRIKTLRAAFAEESAKFEAYYKEHRNNEINEIFLADLVSFLNK